MHTKDFYPLEYEIKLIGPKKQISTLAPADTCAQISVISLQLLKFLGYEESKLKRVRISSIAQQYYSSIAKVKIITENQAMFLDMFVLEGLGFGDGKQVFLGIDFLRKIGFLPRYIKNFSHLYKLIKESKRKCVLVLGSYAKKREGILYSIKKYLGNLGYEGILLKDYPDIEEQSNEEKMNLCGNIARFIICENSFPSGHINELNICSRNTLVTVILQETNCRFGATGMQSSYPVDFNFVKRIFYNPADLESAVKTAVKVGESLVRKRTAKLNKEFTYRKKGLIQ